MIVEDVQLATQDYWLPEEGKSCHDWSAMTKSKRCLNMIEHCLNL